MKPYDRGWIEALIDGEGMLTTRPVIKSKDNGYGRPIMVLTNTDKKLLLRARRIVGGGAFQSVDYGGYRNYARYNNQNWKVCHRLIVRSNVLRKFLPKISLLSKEAQRRILLRMLSLSSVRFSGVCPNPNVRQLVMLQQRLKVLNRKGKL